MVASSNLVAYIVAFKSRARYIYIYMHKRMWYGCHSPLHHGNDVNRNMKIDQSVRLIFGATLAVKSNRRRTVTVNAHMIMYPDGEIQPESGKP